MKARGLCANTVRQWVWWLSLALLGVGGLASWALGLVDVGESRVSISHVLQILMLMLLLRALPIKLPRGDTVHPDAFAVLYGLWAYGIASVLIAILVTGMVTALYERLPGVSRGRFVAACIGDVARRASLASLITPLIGTNSLPLREHDLYMAMIVGMCYVALDDLSWVAQAHIIRAKNESRGESLVSLLQPLAAVNIVHVSIAGVALRVHETLGLGGLLIGLILVVLLQVGLASYFAMRRAYAETIGALARASELDQPEEVGHVERVTGLVVSVGRAMGMRGRELETLRFAALLHEIGRIGAEDISEREAAERGAQIVAQVDRLRQAAPLIEHQGFEAFPETAVSLGAVIIGVCCAYARAEKSGERDATLRLRERWRAHEGAMRVLDAIDFIV